MSMTCHCVPTNFSVLVVRCIWQVLILTFFFNEVFVFDYKKLNGEQILAGT